MDAMMELNSSHRDSSGIIAGALSTVLGLNASEIRTYGNSSFVKLGGDSLVAIRIAAECQRDGLLIPASAFLRAANLREGIAQALNSAQPTSALTPVPNSPLLSSLALLPPLASSGFSETSSEQSLASSLYDTALTTPDITAKTDPLHDAEPQVLSAKRLLELVTPSEWTEPQLLLLRETSDNPERNILTIHEVYNALPDADYICNTWSKTILTEPIFRDLIVDLNLPARCLLTQDVRVVKTEDELRSEVQHAIMTNGPLSRLTVLKLGSESVTVVWRVHHAFLDGYSARTLCEKIGRNLQIDGPMARAGPSFKNVIRALDHLREKKRQDTRRFWETKKTQFAGAVGDFSLSPQRRKNGTPSQRCITLSFPGAELDAARGRTGYTNAVYFAATWALTLGKFLDASRVCFGMVFSGRDLPIQGAFEVVGPLINMLPLYVQLPLDEDESTSVGKFLQFIHDSILELSDLQHSDTTDGLERQFNSILATQFECKEVENSPFIDPNRLDMQSGTPLSLIVQDQSTMQVFYSTAHYSEADMDNVWSVFQKTMSCLLQGDDERLLAPVIRDGLLTSEMEQNIREWSNCQSPETLEESKGDDIVTLFESVVARQPTSMAIVCGTNTALSYDEFDRAAATVAQKLSWIEPNEPVCVYADRSINWVIAIFGVLKAGATYVPLDPSAPSSVRHANYKRSGARAVIFPSKHGITESHHQFGGLLMAVDSILDVSCKPGYMEPMSTRRRIARPDDLAYICFTSGSTGQPKAVQCTHKGLVAFQKDFTVRLCAKKGVTIAQVMSPVFDGSIHEIFSALTYGATLRLASPDSSRHPFEHLQECNSAILTPSIAAALEADQYPNLHHVYLVGEAVPQTVCNAWAANHVLYNMYGPTEATCGATIKRLLPNSPVTLGRANPSSRVYVLDRNRRLLPPGAVGELYLAGVQVSRGYIGLDRENAERFLPDTVLPESGQNMYKTGDYGYWDSESGEICIVGRKDRQIKLHGFRLDLDDLEARIAKAIHPCASAAVFRRGDHLVAAYHVPSNSSGPMNESDVKSLISDALPPYAMPRRIMALPEFPLTAAGKLDYQKLEQMDNSSTTTAQPQQINLTATEEMVTKVVRDLMKLDSAVVLDGKSNLTALGGHSIVQLQLASRIAALIGCPFAVRKVIDNPVISDLALSIDETVKHYATEEQIAEAQTPDCQALEYNKASTPLGAVKLSPIECDWFFKYQKNLKSSSFNVSHLSCLSDSFDQHAALVWAWTEVLARHPLLRCGFRSSDDNGVERFYFDEPPKVEHVETFDARAVINTEFSLDRDYPIRVVISRRQMLVCISHIICDYTTLEVLFEEFRTSYFQKESGKESFPPIPRRQYRDTTCWDEDVSSVTAEFWKSYLANIDFKTLPSYMKGPRTSYQGKSCMIQLSEGAALGFAAVSQSVHLTMHQIALGIVSLVLQADSPTGQDLVLGSPYLGRGFEDMETVGLFLQPLPIRVFRPTPETRMANFLWTTQDSSRFAVANAIQWSSLMKILSTSEDENLRAAADTRAPNHPLFDAMVTFHENNMTPNAATLKSLKVPGIEPLVSWADGSKFAIMFEFSAVSETVVTLRIEYDDSLFSADEVLSMASRVNSALRCLARGTDLITVGELEAEIVRDGGDGLHSEGGVRDVEFGTMLIDLR